VSALSATPADGGSDDATLPTPDRVAPPLPKRSFKYVDKTHAYYLDGKRIKGVTTLLGAGIPKPALPYWSAKMVAEYVINNPEGVQQLRLMGEGPAIAALKQIPWQKRDEAAVRGTDVHALAERIIHGEDVEVPDHLLGHVQGYVQWLEEFDVQPVLTEQPVASRKWRYGGKFDAIVTIGAGRWKGRQPLLDWKTSSGVYGETALQTAAYAKAEFYSPEVGVEIDMPDIDCTGVVHITEGGTSFHPLAHDAEQVAEHFKVFTHAAYLANKADYIKGLVGDPFTIEETEAVA
jgi:hypothetical protein